MTAVMAMLTGQAAALETAVLAGGCFWCLEHDMKKLKGVESVLPGYSGGTQPNPTYETYATAPAGGTPHVEVVQVTYDPAQLNYGQVLDYYLQNVDPTDGGGQFCDRGDAYRPVIFVANPAERAMANDKLAETAAKLGKEVKVGVLPATPFWPAEEYHRDYAAKNELKYNLYRWGCGRDATLNKVWKK